MQINKSISSEQAIHTAATCWIVNLMIFLFLNTFMCDFFPESVDVEDRGRYDGAAEAGLSAAASQELLTVAGVFTDLSHPTALEATRNVSSDTVHFTVS